MSRTLIIRLLNLIIAICLWKNILRRSASREKDFLKKFYKKDKSMFQDKIK